VPQVSRTPEVRENKRPATEYLFSEPGGHSEPVGSEHLDVGEGNPRQVGFGCGYYFAPAS